MAVRIRRNGQIFCAAMTKEMEGDTYLHDGLHYILSVERGLLVTTEFDHHVGEGKGEWWWHDEVAEGVVIDPFYSL